MKKKILVIGDSCRDVHVYCSCDRMSPDKPVPVLKIIDQNDNPGMAKNVYRNIKSLEDSCDIITNSNWTNITKTRYVHKSTNHMFFRLDSAENIKRFNIKEIDYNYDHIVISDYNKGFLAEEDILTISSNHKSVFLDSKRILGPWAEKVRFVKINNFEYDRSKNSIPDTLRNKIIKTAGDDGCYYLEKNYPVEQQEVIDLSGAGDSFLAGLVVKFSETNDIKKAIIFANQCASKVVGQKGVGVI
jgi:bifunctional ADP-heptose synthase (sugar kinase/adenylyltransferase)